MPISANRKEGGMGAVEKILENPAPVISCLILVYLALKELHSAALWWKDRADGYYSARSKREDFHQQVCDIACTSEEHTQALKQIQRALEGISSRLDAADAERKKDTIANARAWLYNMYEELKDRDSLTPNEYGTFKDLADRYLAAGGNSIFRDKIIPDILKKKIDEEGAA